MEAVRVKVLERIASLMRRRKEIERERVLLDNRMIEVERGLCAALDQLQEITN